MTEEIKSPVVEPTHYVDEIDAAMDGAAEAPTVTATSAAELDVPADVTGISAIAQAMETAPAEEIPAVTPRKQHRATPEFPLNMPERLADADVISLPGQFEKETRQVLEDLPNIRVVDSPEAQEWASVIRDSMPNSTYGETFVPSLEDESADFRQRVVHNNASLAAAAPRMRELENTNVKGANAVIRMITHLGLGTLFQVPLWHSGFWITFKPPTDSELIELDRMMAADKISFGRYSYGMAFSNTTVYTNDRLISFALAHVYETTAKSEDINLENLRNHISAQDIPSLLWGFVNTRYPRGFNYRRPCVCDPANCKHIVEETLNVSKLQWTNTNALTDWQRTHMSTRQAKTKDLASITRYKEELTNLQQKRVTINEGQHNELTFTIKTPNITEFIDAGHRWISGIVSIVDRALGTTDNEEERNNLITGHGRATSMCQYSHWVGSIEYATNTINDLDTIEETLKVLSSDEEIRVNFTTTVVDYINKSTLSLIGIPVFDCPKCGKTADGSYDIKGLKNIIPLDVIQVFFALLTQRLDRLAQR